MHTFKDTEGRDWNLAIHVGVIKRVRVLAGIDLYKLVDDGLRPLGELCSDPVKFVDVLYCLCRDETEKRGVSDEQFGASLGGDALEAALDAFVAELIDFFPNRRARTALQKLLEKGRTLATRMVDRAESELEKIDLDKIENQLMRSSTGSPASSA